jgi:exopolysaccharide biosynthesis polyprenyl glycosylphosphotransferase
VNGVGGSAAGPAERPGGRVLSAPGARTPGLRPGHVRPHGHPPDRPPLAPSPGATAAPAAPAPAGTAPPSAAPAVARRHRRRAWLTRRALAATDVVALALAVVAVGLLADRLTPDQTLAALAGLPLALVCFRANGLYQGDVRRIGHMTIDDVPGLVKALPATVVLLWAWLSLLGEPPASFGTLLWLGALGGGLVLVARATARRGLRAALAPERVLLVGDGPELPALARKLRKHASYGAEPVAVVSLSEPLDLERAVGEAGVERVIIAGDEADCGTRLELLRRCKQLSLRVGVVPRLHEALGQAVLVDEVEGITLLSVPAPVLSPSARALKRAIDVVGAALGLLLAAPLLLVLAVAIKRDSRGPVLFRQRRVGQWGRRFRIAKLRTMVVDAEARQAELLAHSRDPGWLLIDDDPRVTRVGRFLRRTSLDELPQLWNVLRGQMSLVGPRPLIESEDRQLSGWRRSRVDLKPGLTGLWQILGRTDIPFDEMVTLDYLYVTNWSLWGDVRLLLRTIPVLLSRRGAN